MPDFNQANEFVFTLPQEVQEDILRSLNYSQSTIDTYRSIRDEAPTDNIYYRYNRYYNQMKQRLIGQIYAYNVMGIYPVYGWSGHRTEFFFPTQEDCDLEYDYYLQCGE